MGRSAVSTRYASDCMLCHVFLLLREQMLFQLMADLSHSLHECLQKPDASIMKPD